MKMFALRGKKEMERRLQEEILKSQYTNTYQKKQRRYQQKNSVCYSTISTTELAQRKHSYLPIQYNDKRALIVHSQTENFTLVIKQVISVYISACR